MSKKYNIRIERKGLSGSMSIDNASSVSVFIFRELFNSGFFAPGVSVRFSEAEERVNFSIGEGLKDE